MKGTTSARILSKGKSFDFSEWKPFVQYTNDCFKQDFVSYNNALLVCKETHLSTSDAPPTLLYENPDNQFVITGVDSPYWTYVMSGAPGMLYIPEYNDETGELGWRISTSAEDIDTVKIKLEGPWKASDGEDSVSLGDTNKTYGNHSVASGTNSIANGDNSHAFGNSVRTTNNGEAAFGRFNQSIADQTLFSIGNGQDDSNRKNILEIKLDGSFYYDGVKKDFLTFKEINDLIAIETQRATNIENLLAERIDILSQSAEVVKNELLKLINNEILRSTEKDLEFDKISDKVILLIGDDNNKSVREISLEEINKVINGAPEAFDTLKEISDYIADHDEDALQMQNNITEVRNILKWAEFD